MCGIAGVFDSNKNSIPTEVIQQMTRAVAHRGPDGEGVFTEENVGLGHRRLAIIDLTENAAQPMTTEDGAFAITYNGEIYNYLDLRRDLENLGHRFRSHSDTEVLLYCLRQWGPQSLIKLNGMFAFALWDKKNSQITLARDRFGVKPLYYTVIDGKLIFGSEIKALREHPKFKTKVNREGLVEYFTFQNFFGDRTLFDGVKLLPAGHFLEFRTGDKEPRVTKYWDYHFCDSKDMTQLTEGEYVEELDRLFKQAVHRQLVGDVDLGAYLSGGIDSGAITAIASEKIQNLRTFTCGFDLHSASGLELAYDERELAELMSYMFKTEQYEMVLKAGDMEKVLNRLAWHIEEPRVGQSYPNFYMAQLASKFVKVVLAGTGGDELFGGYPWRYYRAVVNQNFDQYADKYYDFWQRLIPGDTMADTFKPIWSSVAHVNTKQIFKNVFDDHQNELSRPEDYVNHSLYFEAKTFLHGLLVVEDKIAMAHGLESRVPFLDNDLVDFAMKVPVKYKLGNLKEVIRQNENESGWKTSKYFEKTGDGKLLLRKMLRRYLPDRISTNKKQGFSAPDGSWFRGESIDYVRTTLYNSDARIYEYLDRRTIQNLVNDHLEGKTNRRLLIWSLLNFEHWCQRFL